MHSDRFRNTCAAQCTLARNKPCPLCLSHAHSASHIHLGPTMCTMRPCNNSHQQRKTNSGKKYAHSPTSIPTPQTQNTYCIPRAKHRPNPAKTRHPSYRATHAGTAGTCQDIGSQHACTQCGAMCTRLLLQQPRGTTNQADRLTPGACHVPIAACNDAMLLSKQFITASQL